MSASGRKERPLKQRFDNAVSMIRSLPKEGPFQPSNTVKLRFYALYKQSTEGPCTLAKPSFWDAVGRAKWEAWTVCGKMSAELAMQMYIEELKQMVETSPQTPEAEAFLETIKQYPDEDVGTASANEESAAGSAESGSGSVGAAESGEGEGRGEEAGAMAADDVEKDHPKAPKKKEEVSGDGPERADSGETSDSDDFQDSFQVLPNSPQNQGEDLGPSAERHRVAFSTMTEDGGRSVVPQSQTAGGVSVEDVLPQMLSIQSNLQSILEQLASLVSSISSLPQLRPPQPHPPQQVRGLWQRRRVLYRVVPFLLGWPFIVQFLLRFLIRRSSSSSSSSSSLPWWAFSLLTFLHTTFTMALLTVSSR